MTRNPYVAIILAGGLSSRMNRFKPLLPLGNSTVVNHVIHTFRRNDVDVILVGGYRRGELFTSVIPGDIILKENPDYENGMFSSVLAGLQSVNPENRGVFIMPADIPLVRSATVRTLLAKARENPHKLLYPVFKGRRGHPPVIPAELLSGIAFHTGEGGLRAALAGYEDTAIDVPLADGGILLDIDTPQDYEAVVARFNTHYIPTAEECEAIFEITGTSQDRIEHGRVTSRVAEAIGRALQEAGHEVDIGLVTSAALLHDIAKGKSKHDEAGGDILRGMGFDLVADIVSIHTDLGGKLPDDIPLSVKIVYLADKYVRGDKIVGLETRYQISRKQYGKDPDIDKHVLLRKERALRVRQEIETLIGTPLEHIVFTETEK